MDIAIVKVYCSMCGGLGIGQANLSLPSNRFGRKPSICRHCWAYLQTNPKDLYYDFPRPKRYDNGEDIVRN